MRFVAAASRASAKKRGFISKKKNKDRLHCGVSYDVNSNLIANFQLLSEDNKNEDTPVARFRQNCGDFVNNPGVQNIMISLIVINSIIQGIETLSFVQGNPELKNSYDVCNHIFLLVFTIEILLQTIFYGFYIFYDGWLTFDFAIILISWAFDSFSVIRGLRIVRATRLVTRVKSMRQVCAALLNVLPKLVYIMTLLVISLFIFAVMFTYLFKDLYPDYTSEDYFSSLEQSVFTLFQMMTMDGWSEICREVQSHPDYWWAWIPFMIAVIIPGFIIANLMIAVICDSVADLREDENYTEEENENSKKCVDDDTNRARGTIQGQIDDILNRVEGLIEAQEKTQMMMTLFIMKAKDENSKK